MDVATLDRCEPCCQQMLLRAVRLFLHGHNSPSMAKLIRVRRTRLSPGSTARSRIMSWVQASFCSCASRAGAGDSLARYEAGDQSGAGPMGQGRPLTSCVSALPSRPRSRFRLLTNLATHAVSDPVAYGGPQRSNDAISDHPWSNVNVRACPAGFWIRRTRALVVSEACSTT